METPILTAPVYNEIEGEIQNISESKDTIAIWRTTQKCFKLLREIQKQTRKTRKEIETIENNDPRLKEFREIKNKYEEAKKNYNFSKTESREIVEKLGSLDDVLLMRSEELKTAQRLFSVSAFHAKKNPLQLQLFEGVSVYDIVPNMKTKKIGKNKDGEEEYLNKLTLNGKYDIEITMDGKEVLNTKKLKK